MKPDHRKRISHYQTLRYPVNSLEGQDFMTFVKDPEQINQYVRTYGTISNQNKKISPPTRYNNDDNDNDNEMKA